MNKMSAVFIALKITYKIRIEELLQQTYIKCIIVEPGKGFWWIPLTLTSSATFIVPLLLRFLHFRPISLNFFELSHHAIMT